MCLCAYCPKHLQYVNTAPLGRCRAAWCDSHRLRVTLKTGTNTDPHTRQNTPYTNYHQICCCFWFLSAVSLFFQPFLLLFSLLGQCDRWLHQSSNWCRRKHPCLCRTHLRYSHNWWHVSIAPHYTTVNGLFLFPLLPSTQVYFLRITVKVSFTREWNLLFLFGITVWWNKLPVLQKGIYSMSFIIVRHSTITLQVPS